MSKFAQSETPVHIVDAVDDTVDAIQFLVANASNKQEVAVELIRLLSDLIERVLNAE
ncbi:hypothetical protein [Deinococcus radiodurans]|jgi:hypothetical protein|uniref:hypothetical protein n=1 Tax=Deinococcus radiodurans TaxID=1299 RepID=UPI0002F23C8C|nr:hypothetical protein [Deinococcus radiodurans]QIP30412.1 hypothetical protein HAV23_14260 [Deinococcus radiodurans]QIP33229.1 hypothetical protein HAV35_13730 [Deinococcus radiodurans]UID71678.1 hypothetical protein DRO_A0089 [Deinococcus radiodurans R1 = ATCC 13939 = DSM 20539]UTA52205.1 DUF2452 domain-containing protein [Deinococcus radiodurans]